MRKMNQNFQAIVQNTREDNTSNDQTFLLGGVLIVFNVFVMLFVGLYWMNPVMHEFISGRPLL
ncbi:hypothetical protein DNJ72_06375 [Prochlorococcus marinus XMU1403]|uniref:Uncharacterized protein n=2 Tax=Prochlorococcaceae TaxID=2881426 RepID=A2C3P7_PROM1|nr:Hypothetical protein NATL1_15501 [Prochlorococcus marinus str. NATL1A]MBW3049770.1 hypothetical protein [Prochlorococcus marinus str. MU1403]PYE01583.1 hypothetical protein DNJ72_06375 [Prochlorococcus marinus XMU1403]